MTIEYKIAEFLVHNHVHLKSNRDMAAAYAKAMTLHRTEAIDMILETLRYVLSEHFAPLEIEEAFETDEVGIILHKYFVKDWQYEH